MTVRRGSTVVSILNLATWPASLVHSGSRQSKNVGCHENGLRSMRPYLSKTADEKKENVIKLGYQNR